jgi:hypothetical protein
MTPENNLTAPAYSNFIQPDSDDSEVTLNSRSFIPALQIPRQLSNSDSGSELNIYQIPQPALVSPNFDSHSQASPTDVAEPEDNRKQLASKWDNSELESETDVADQNDQAIPNSLHLPPSDVLTRLQQFSFSPVKRLAELSFNTLRTHPSSFASEKKQSYSVVDAPSITREQQRIMRIWCIKIGIILVLHSNTKCTVSEG